MKCNVTIFGVAMVLLAVVLMPAASARAEYVTGFESAEGYTLNSEIGGVNGWQIISGNSAHATIRNNLVNSGAQALRLSDTLVVTHLGREFGEDFGDQVIIEASLAMDGQQVGMFSLYFGTGSFTDPKGLLGSDWTYTAAQFGFDGTQVYYRNGDGWGIWTDTGDMVAWPVVILPYIEEKSKRDVYNASKFYWQPENYPVTTNRISVFTCPSDSPSMQYDITCNNYVGNYGNTGYVRDIGRSKLNVVEELNEVVFAGAPFELGLPSTAGRRVCTFARISDGLSSTLLISETVQGHGEGDVRGLIWWDCAARFETYLSPNSCQPDVTQTAEHCNNDASQNPPCVGPHTDDMPMTLAARSRHPGGVQAVLCDGSVRFISDDIALDTWRKLSTTRGGEVVGQY